MINRISTFKTGVLFLLIAFSTSSCAQEPKKAEQTKSKIQTTTEIVQKAKMSVDGMTCSACQSNVKKTIKSIYGVTDAEVDLGKKTAFFTYDPQKVKVDSIQKKVNDLGYTAGTPKKIKPWT